MRKIFYAIFLLSLFVNANSIIVTSQQEDSTHWIIDYSVSNSKAVSTQVSTVTRDIDANSIFAPNEELPTASLFLIDSSTPMKKAYVEGIKPTILKLFSQKNPWDYWGVAQFDTQLTMRGDFNQTDVNNSLNAIQIQGQETELFRFSIDAIKLLKEQEANRKFLVLFTDGMAEDQGYLFEDVIKEAKLSNVTILCFGYQKTSVAIGNLRRLATDTGGKLWIADENSFQLKESDYQEFEQSINGGGQVRFSKSQFPPNETGKETITLTVKLDNNDSVTTDMTIPVAKLKKEEENPLKLWLLIGGVLALLLLLFFVLRPKKTPPPVDEKPKIPNGKKEEEILEPIAYFETISGSKLYAYKPYTTIGALSENDIVIDGDQISRRHAALEFKDNEFYIIDTNSANGTFVNYGKERISSQKIEDGDTILFAEYPVIFKVIEED